MTSLAVTGLGRCGTSAMMHLLDCGGQVLVHGSHPDYEVAASPEEQVEVPHHAYKLINPHQTRVRPDFAIWLNRDVRQQAMSGLRLVGGDTSRQARKRLEAQLRKENAQCMRLLKNHSTRLLVVSFEVLLKWPFLTAIKVGEFLGEVWPGLQFCPSDAALAVHDRGADALVVPWEHTMQAGGKR